MHGAAPRQVGLRSVRKQAEQGRESHISLPSLLPSLTLHSYLGFSMVDIELLAK